MSEEEDLLKKMDALLKRHQAAPADDGDIPTLTDIVAAADAPVSPAASAAPPPSAPPSPPAARDMEQRLAPLLNDWLARNLSGKLDELGARIEQRVREVVAEELQKHLETLADDYARLLREAGRDTSPGGTSDNGDSV